MTYKNLKKFLSNNQNNAKIDFDLMPHGVKSKIIFCVGTGACNTAAFLSSVLSEKSISHSRYINCDELDIKDRFLQNGRQLEIDMLCKNAEKIIKKSGKEISNKALLFTLSLLLLDDEYLIIEMDDDFYEAVVGGINFTPLAILFTSLNDENNQKLIDMAPCGVSEIFAVSKAENYDYISSVANKNGTRVSYATGNKITVSKQTLWGTDIYYFSYSYHLSSIDQRNNILAVLALDCAKVLFGISKATIYKGLSKAKLLYDFELYSICPNILLHSGDMDFILPQNMKYNIITSCEDFVFPTENTLFCGNAEFIEQVKEKLKK